MARKDDILSIYTKEVEGIKEAGLFKGEAPFVSPQGARVKMEDGRELLLPAIKDCILNVNLEENIMKIHVLEGLLD